LLREVPRSAGSKVDPDDEGEYQMAVSVQVASGEYHLFGDWGGVSRGNDFLSHLRARAFAAATVRAYAYDVANFARFLEEHEIALVAVEPMDVFAWVDWQGARTPATTQTVVRLKPRSAAPATINPNTQPAMMISIVKPTPVIPTWKLRSISPQLWRSPENPQP